MISRIEPCSTPHTPESLVTRLAGEPGVSLLRGARGEGDSRPFTLVTARPFLVFRSMGAHCRVLAAERVYSQYGNPWRILGAWISRYEQLDHIDLPFPLGGCLGYWGYDLKNFVEPGLPQRAVNDLELPDCQLGFYSSLVVFDHAMATTWIVATGLTADGSRHPQVARDDCRFWRHHLQSDLPSDTEGAETPPQFRHPAKGRILSNVSRARYLLMVEQAQRYIRSGDIYQVNLCQRFAARYRGSAWTLYRRLAAVSPAPYAAFLDLGQFQIASSSPELFLRLSGNSVRTRPIKGTRPRSPDGAEDTRLAYELQTSPKELAELVMITDLLRNDLGRVCEFGSIRVPELARLQRFAHVHHLVSTVEGQLRSGITHMEALASSFPGGSITGAPKVRAMQIIDELEPVTRGPYTGAMGYLGFNRESQLSILIRTALCQRGLAFFHAGAGIVADSAPEAEFEETVAKARGFFDALASFATPELVPKSRHPLAAAEPDPAPRPWSS